MRECLLHSSGIGDFFGKRFEETPKNHFRTLTDYLPAFAEQPLAFAPGASTYAYALSLPADPGVVVPGYWMLFAIDANGVPSVAKVILVEP